MNNRDGPVKIGDYFMIQHSTTHTYLQNIVNE
jgi:hypothetical protein